MEEMVEVVEELEVDVVQAADRLGATRTIEMSAKGVSVWFGKRKILENVNIDFPKKPSRLLLVRRDAVSQPSFAP